jgi:hypothetical protein
MSRFKLDRQRTVGNTALTVKLKSEEDEDLVKHAIKVLEESKKRLANTATALARNHDNVTKVGRVFFAPNELGPDDLKIIKANVALIEKGLSGESLMIKTTRDEILGHGEKADNVSGATTMFFSRGGHDTYDSDRRRKYTNQEKRDNWVDLPIKPHHNQCSSEGKMYVTGTIRIRGARLEDSQLGPVTLLHEASHRYAGTFDYWYFPDDAGKRPLELKEYEEVDKRCLAGDPGKKVLHNADSYAWFIYWIGGLTD